jgi:transcriptional regulator with XRE-family HTH domain
MMHDASEKKRKVRSIAERLDDYRLSLGLTWKQVAERLDLSVPMLMQVRSGLRNMSDLALRRFEGAERSARVESRARKVADDLLEDRGIARELIEKYSTDPQPVEMPLKYRRVSGIEGLPRTVRLKHLSETERERLILVFRRTLEPRILILACIEDSDRNERLLPVLTRRCFEDLQEFAFAAVFGPEWMTAISRIATESADNSDPTPIS